MRVAHLLAAAGVAFGLLAGSASAQERPLKVVGPWEIAGIDPAQSGYIFSRMQVAETLVSVDADGKLTAGLEDPSWSGERGRADLALPPSRRSTFS